MSVTEFEWQCHPAAADFLQHLLHSACQTSPIIDEFSARLHAQTGTRLQDWVDHWRLLDSPELQTQLTDLGFAADGDWWRHSGGLFPPIHLHSEAVTRLSLKVDSVSDFLFANPAYGSLTIFGSPGAQLREAHISTQTGVALWVVERHGTGNLQPDDLSDRQQRSVLCRREAFRHRRRSFSDSRSAFANLSELLSHAIDELGVDRTCDLFFATERDYWQSRNEAAAVQKRRQDRLGMGWANHDHHTYRSSRSAFASLIAILEQLGFQCRERFYAGEEAGWGAQVIEQARCGITVFADVDLNVDEVAGDFAHEGLVDSPQMGTVGLWCALHGEAMFEAGMHHLECQFDFDVASQQLASSNVPRMAPFTDLPYLRQAFTQGAIWPVDSRRIETLLQAGQISEEQAEHFRNRGAVGSHLEILQREQGFKGFNQTGISGIIRKTDPRSLAIDS